ncbi:kinase-like domain-containing protein [Cantharellus anzutake]|uniref:kinase-like domain-containing protein n=1 Tax=Cantharellus anzutake TaxID=1750568 RepID=UPI001907135A|nr:kinase-like domain-containing protein [Cantharellus anzutake]KAF8331647.1 kinase-like domain-containing protein [Cantharellus anzutake]
MVVWCKLAHDHVVRLHGWIPYLENPEILCPGLVSNWCDGGDVTTFLKRSPQADRQALICGIACGLEYLHSKKVVHGDMKPDNVVMGDKSTPQLCDFGLSFITSDKTTFLHASSMFATGRYLAPEVFESEEPFRNEKTDVWAFGCTAMEILRSEPPYSTTRNELAVFKVIGTTPPFDLSPTQPTEEILVRCLNFDPEGRINMGDVAKRLKQNGSRSGCPDNSSATQSFSYPLQFPSAAILST